MCETEIRVKAEKTSKKEFNKKTLDAMAEAKNITHDSTVPGYTSMKDLKMALESD